MTVASPETGVQGTGDGPAAAGAVIETKLVTRRADLGLLASFLRENPFQPATGFFRAVEVGVVASHGLPDGRGLDLACGDGRLFGLLVDRLGGTRPTVTGLDLDPLETASAAATGRYDDVLTASAAAIPAADAVFDWVFSNSALEHIPPIEETLAEVGRILRPGGRFIFTVPSEQLHDCLAGPLWGDREQYLQTVDARCAHLRYWSPSEWEAALQRAGLRLTLVERYLTRPQARRWETLSRWTSGLLYAILRRPPIEMQRSFGMRRGQRLPRLVAAALARVLALGVGNETSGPSACLYIVATRP